MIAEHVGNEGVFKGFLGSISHIWSKEGLSGFYSGIVPALLQETAYVTFITLMTRLVIKLMEPLTKV